MKVDKIISFDISSDFGMSKKPDVNDIITISLKYFKTIGDKKLDELVETILSLAEVLRSIKSVVYSV